MNIPGFTAEESLYNVNNQHYQTIAGAHHYAGVVQPATHPHFTDLSVTNNPPLSCLRYKCRTFYIPEEIEICGWHWVC